MLFSVLYLNKKHRDKKITKELLTRLCKCILLLDCTIVVTYLRVIVIVIVCVRKAAMRTLLLSILFFLSSSSTTFSSPVDERAVCGDFVEGACDLSEYNIIEHNRYTDTPKECQV